MCGIAGAIAPSSLHAGLSRPMSEAIAHRGPDGHGAISWNNVLLIHRRLSIVDLSEAGAQPMSCDERLSVVYNGEIYNHLELRSELEKLGHQFTSHSDTEVLLRAWSHWGESCLHKFNGMWAFALLDREKGKLWLVRDRFGVKPLYISKNRDSILFASEIGSLLAVGDRPSPDLEMVQDFLKDGLVDHREQTFFKGIRRLLPSHLECWDLRALTCENRRWYHPQSSKAIDLLPLITDAVRLRMRADVKVGTCLSGGLDSSLIAALASHMTDGLSFTAVHASTGYKLLDETHFAQQVVDHHPMSMHVIQPTVQDYLDQLDEVVRTQQEPFGSLSIGMQYFVMKKARELGCKVMLDGQAADEIFLGYLSYVGPLAWSALLSGDIGSFIRILLRHPRTVFSAGIKKLLGRSSKKLSVRAFQLDEIYSLHLQALLRYEDRNSMRHGVEARLPYMDYRLVEAALDLPLSEKINGVWQKLALRKAASNVLPDSICWRKDKMGFVAPTTIALQTIKSQVDHDIAHSPLLRNLGFDKVAASEGERWRRFCVARWEKIFL